MASILSRFILWTMTFVMMVLMNITLARTPVTFSNVEATYHAGDNEDLKRTIDGINSSATGWHIGGKLDKPQSILFTLDEPMEADHIELTMYFMSGQPRASFSDFSVTYTTDTVPSKNGNWQPITLLNFSATTCKLSLGNDNHILAEEVSPIVTGAIPDDIYRISTRLLGKPITGFQITTYPVSRESKIKEGPIMAWNDSGDFLLTEFRVEVLSTTTNVALGTPVTATHPLYRATRDFYQKTPLNFRKMTASSITDGWPSTLAHPDENMTGKDFYFEIDLGRHRSIDHLNLRQRGDNYKLNRFGKMRIKIYDKDPKTGAAPTWQTLNRPDGSFPPKGTIDTLRANNGKGKFHGRYIRISSESKVPRSPMLAEIEVYETRTSKLISVTADNQSITNYRNSSLSIPPSILRLAFQFKIPQQGKPKDHYFRWRIPGENKDWQTSSSFLLEIPCPPNGDYQPPFSPIRSGPKAASSTPRQKQIPSSNV